MTCAVDTVSGAYGKRLHAAYRSTPRARQPAISGELYFERFILSALNWRAVNF
jgi:hypothetical protein